MAIFKRHEQRDQQTTAASAAQTVQVGEPLQQARIVPPFVASGTATQAATAPGVVPPAAAEMYSMRVPESGSVDTASGSLIVEKVRTARETQQTAQENIQERVRVAVQKARTASAPAAAPRRRQVQRAAPAPHRPGFDASRCAQTGLLNLAWSWQQAGAPIRAIHAYMQLLSRYPGTEAADAAVADLVELSDRLAQQGQYHIALAIYEQLEQLA